MKAVPSSEEVESAEADVQSLYVCGCVKIELCGCGMFGAGCRRSLSARSWETSVKTSNHSVCSVY